MSGLGLSKTGGIAYVCRGAAPAAGLRSAAAAAVFSESPARKLTAIITIIPSYYISFKLSRLGETCEECADVVKVVIACGTNRYVIPM